MFNQRNTEAAHRKLEGLYSKIILGFIIVILITSLYIKFYLKKKNESESE